MKKENRVESGTLHGQGRGFNPLTAHHLRSHRNSHSPNKSETCLAKPKATDDHSKTSATTASNKKVGKKWVNENASITRLWNRFWRRVA